jgi:hypothetical protein
MISVMWITGAMSAAGGIGADAGLGGLDNLPSLTAILREGRKSRK